MKALVCAASKHGATAEIGEAIARALSDNGVPAEVRAPQQVADVRGYDAIVLGSAVYAGRWMAGARDLADRLSEQLHGTPVWLFSSGPVGNQPVSEDKPAVNVTGIEQAVGARGHALFGGKIVRAQLGLVERTIVSAMRVRDGDERDWDRIAAWGKQIAEELKAAEPKAAEPEDGA